MWHVSISGGQTFAALRSQAKVELHGVGDARLGEWGEESASGGLRFYHLRRRLRPYEADMVGPVRDIRRTAEHQERIAAIKAWLPPHMERLIRSDWP